MFTLRETPSARPRGFLLEQGATSVWDKTSNCHQTAIVIAATTSSLSTLSLGVLKFQHTHLLVFGSTDSASSSSHIIHSVGFAALDISDSDRFQCSIHNIYWPLWGEPSCLSLSSIKMTSDVLPCILNDEFWHLNNINKHVVSSPLKRFWVFPRVALVSCIGRGHSDAHPGVLFSNQAWNMTEAAQITEITCIQGGQR